METKYDGSVVEAVILEEKTTKNGINQSKLHRSIKQNRFLQNINKMEQNVPNIVGNRVSNNRKYLNI